MSETPAVKVRSAARAPLRAQAVAYLVTTDRTAPEEFDWAFLAATGFEGKAGQVAALPGENGVARLLAGIGDRKDLTPSALRQAGAALARSASRFPRLSVDYPDGMVERIDPRDGGQALAEGLILGAYRFDRYKERPDPLPVLREVVVVSRLGRDFSSGVTKGAAIAGGVNFARDLVNEPGGHYTPATLAKVVVERAMAAGLRVKLMDETAIAAARLGGLMAVSRGSTQPPRFVELTYDPAGARHSLALVGKGVTFDSGGLSLKTAEGMTTMKCDKGGAAAVFGAMMVLPALKPKVKVTAYVPLTDNMPGPDAQRPGDVFTARNGKTVEVLNTDAEGRLILADALALAAEAEPDAVVDLATLTGACMVALGPRIAGLMGNHSPWVEQVGSAAADAGERVWPLPLPDDYRTMIESTVADLKNIGNREGGALTAGLFLSEFVPEDLPWAHLDIAGPAFAGEAHEEHPRGATGFGVRTLIRLVERFRPPRD